MARGLPLPNAIRNAPRLTQGLELYFGAFFDLTSCRYVGMSEGPIPWTAIDTYCKSLDITEDLREGLFYHVRAMDNEYLKHIEKKAKHKKG